MSDFLHQINKSLRDAEVADNPETAKNALNNSFFAQDLQNGINKIDKGIQEIFRADKTIKTEQKSSTIGVRG